jgi:formate/nitrite transporter FocA (FNT family)
MRRPLRAVSSAGRAVIERLGEWRLNQLGPQWSDEQSMTDNDSQSNAANVEKPSVVTERALERNDEDRQYVPVIVKRVDEARRHPDDTLERAVREGAEQLSRKTLSLSLSSVAAGLILGFTAMSVAVASEAAEPLDAELLRRFFRSLAYPLGFVMCVLSGAQLFTEHTATAVYPVLDGRATVRRLVRLWAIVIAGNLVGTAISAVLLAGAEPIVAARAGYAIVASHLVGFPTMALLISAVLAGWLMAMGAWLMLSTSDTTAQMLLIYTVTFLIGIGGLHHSIAGSAELLTAYAVGLPIGAGQIARTIGLSLVGNLIGGSMFVAVLNYAHLRATQPAADE